MRISVYKELLVLSVHFTLLNFSVTDIILLYYFVGTHAHRRGLGDQSETKNILSTTAFGWNEHLLDQTISNHLTNSDDEEPTIGT